MRLALAVISLVLLTAASAPKYKGIWVAIADENSSQTIRFEKKKFVKVGRVVPARLYELTDASAVAAFAIPYLGRGTLMVPVDESQRKFCRLERHAGSAFGCLADSDGDGRLDTFFGTQVFKEFFTGSVGDDGGHEKLVRPVSIEKVNASEKAPNIDLEFTYLGKSMKGDIVYQLCMSKKIMDNIKYFQSPSRKGFSVVCTDKLHSRVGARTKIQGFGIDMTMSSADNKTLIVEQLRTDGSTFETSSGFR